MSSKHRNKHQICPNCGYEVGDKNYCPECGQENHDLNLSFGHLVLEAFENTLHFDTKLWTSLKTVFTKPGQITKDFVEGKRARHIPPFRMYVFIAVVFFFVVNSVSEKTINQEENGNIFSIATGLVKFDNKQLRSQIKDLPKEKQPRYVSQLDTTFKQMGTGKFGVEVINEIDKVVNDAQERIEDIVETDSSDARFSQLPDSLQQRYISTLDTLHQQLQKMPAKQVYLKQHGTLGEEKLHIGVGLGDIANYGSKQIELTYGEAEAVTKMEKAELAAFCQKRGQHYSDWELKRFKYNAKMEILPKSERIHVYIKYISYAMFFLMPIFAFLLEIWFRRPARNYYEHFIFSLHFHSVLFLFMIILWLLVSLSTYLNVIDLRVGWFIFSVVLYMFFSIRNFYPPSVRTTDGWLYKIWKNLGFENAYLHWHNTFSQQTSELGSDSDSIKKTSSFIQKAVLFSVGILRKIVRNIRIKELWYVTKVFWLFFWYSLLIALGYLATMFGSTLLV